MKEKLSLPDLFVAFSQYNQKPDDKNFKKFWQIYKYYCFTKNEFDKGKDILKRFSYNSASFNFANKDFYQKFESKWVPNNIPTFAISSEEDYICPSGIFFNNKYYFNDNIINIKISNAGHFPWLNNFEELQNSFIKFINDILMYHIKLR